MKATGRHCSRGGVADEEPTSMLTPTPLPDQLAACRDDPLRVLIVGAGIAGVTLAQLLRRRGLHPVLVERTAPDADRGYMLALMPLVDPVLTELDVIDEYLARSVELRRYRVRDRTGVPIRTYPVTTLFDRFGHYRGIGRGELLEVLGAQGGPVTRSASVTALEQIADAVRAVIDDGSGPQVSQFDVVVAADGLHSRTRGLVLDSNAVTTFDSGWGCWVAWTDLDDAADLCEEVWGAGLFVGCYPVRDRLGVVVGGPRADTVVGPTRFAARAWGALRRVDDRFDRALAAVVTSDDAYYWSLIDYRSATWATGRIVLLGDAAAGFLPTAGIGAGMAMESAGVLAARLHAATAGQVPTTLRDYERTQRPRVEAAQANSRRLARLLFRRSPLLAAARDAAVRILPLQATLGPIRALLEQAPDQHDGRAG
jgi:2-polyprenyl-6-methoxyphenol hydroxylase-like FAD-dependent oxidoreductase